MIYVWAISTIICWLMIYGHTQSLEYRVLVKGQPGNGLGITIALIVSMVPVFNTGLAVYGLSKGRL